MSRGTGIAGRVYLDPGGVWSGPIAASISVAGLSPLTRGLHCGIIWRVSKSTAPRSPR